MWLGTQKGRRSLMQRVCFRVASRCFPVGSYLLRQLQKVLSCPRVLSRQASSCHRCQNTRCTISETEFYCLPGKTLSLAISFSRGSSQPKNWTWVCHIAGSFFTIWATREAPHCSYTRADGNQKVPQIILLKLSFASVWRRWLFKEASFTIFSIRQSLINAFWREFLVRDY